MKNLGLVEFGHRELFHEGLAQPVEGPNINGFVHMTIQTEVRHVGVRTEPLSTGYRPTLGG